jgi:hypothetical protein
VNAAERRIEVAGVESRIAAADHLAAPSSS